jgi:hypothetical protein
LATTFGNRNNNPELSPSAFLVDRCDNIYFSGWGSPIDYDGLHSLTTFGLPISSNAIQPNTDNKDFYLLVLNKNQIINRKELLNKIWGNDDFFSGRSMDVYITQLRKKLQKDASIQIINIRGLGYKIVY